MKNNDYAGMTAYLSEPYRGYRAIRLVKKVGYQWMAEIIGSGKEIEVYEDEFTIYE